MDLLANLGNLWGVDGLVLCFCMLMALAITGAIIFAAIMVARKHQAGGGSAPSATTTGQQMMKVCENCGRPIGALEQVRVWKEKHTVCAECFARLQAQS